MELYCPLELGTSVDTLGMGIIQIGGQMLLKVGLLLKSKRTGKLALIVRKQDNGFGTSFRWDVLRSDGKVVRISSRGLQKIWVEVVNESR